MKFYVSNFKYDLTDDLSGSDSVKKIINSKKSRYDFQFLLN